ncbi:MAG: hypothetical protein J0I20_28730 [Chloroflexi bacterium]|nr:hypothetical protein [Chloroflexota bacterium]OJV96296.1 MAG: hypothetical protein BGO39_00860 [Chloroflexi bacterium 54-19]
MVGNPSSKSLKISLLLALLLVCMVTLAACGGEATTTATVSPTAAPTAIPAPDSAPAYLAWTDFKYADEAEQASQAVVKSRPDFPAWASWTESNRWYLLVKDSSSDRLKAKVGKDATISPVPFVAEAQAAAAGSYQAYALNLERVSVDIKAGGAKEAAQMLFNRAIQQSQIASGLLVFALGDDQIFALLPKGVSSEKVLPLASVGKLEMVGAGSKSLDDGTIIATSASPALGGLTLKNMTTYQTVADNHDFISFKGSANNLTGAIPVLSFDLRPNSKIFEYSRANLGKYAALVFDHQVISSAVIAAALKDKGQMQVPRWAGAGGQADMQRFIDFMNANPPQLFEAKTLDTSANFVYSGTFTR